MRFLTMVVNVVSARVVRVAAPSQYGIEFTDVDADVSTRIRHFLETLEQV